MRKKALLALMMALTLLLSSCALIVKDEAVDNATVIIRMGDQEINKEKVKEEVENQLDSAAYMNQIYGRSFDRTDPEVISQAQDAAVEALKRDLALSAKAKELGLDKLTDEELETVKTKAQEGYDYALDYVKQYQLENTEGMDEEALAKAAADKLTEMKISLDTYTEGETKTIIDDKLREYAIKDVTVSDDEIKADYDAKVEADKTSYENNAGSWATAANNGTTLYYTPAGIRRVKQILTKFKDEDQTAINDANTKLTEANTARTAAQAKIDSANEHLKTEGISEEDKAAEEANLSAAQQELEEADKALIDAGKAVDDATNKAFENIDADTDAILAALDAGEDWQKLMDEKNQDSGMKNNEKGYAVSADMTSFDKAFVEAAMALEKIGDHSGKIKGTSYGYYIIRYESDEKEGPADLETVKETISSALLKTKQNNTYNDTVAQWVEEAGIKVDLNALKN